MRLRTLTAACFILLATNLPAENMISFNLDRCSWSATHVVVVTEGDAIDGKVTVLQSWKGDVEPPQTIEIPELAVFHTEKSRLVRSWWFGPKEETLPSHVTGERLILFLKESPQTHSWEAANEEMLVSVLWIENDESFAFHQETNPGDRILLPNDSSEQEIRSRFAEVNEIHEALNRALEIPDLAARARTLEPLTSSELYDARDAAFTGLLECGRAAVPVLYELLHDETRLSVHGEVIRVLSMIGGDGVGEELTSVVREALLFWRATSPRLSEEWWNDIEEPGTNDLRDRYSKLYDALNGLQKLKFAGSRDVVMELCDFWRSLPQLKYRSSPEQMSKSCDAVLSATSP